MQGGPGSAQRAAGGGEEVALRFGTQLLGVAARGLTSLPQLELFGSPEAQRNQHLDAALDDIRNKFGKDAVARGSTLRSRLRSKP